MRDMSIQEILDRLNTIDEDPFIEAKLDRRKVGKETRKTVSAFSNTEGGWVLMGVQTEGSGREKRYIGVGVEDPDKIQSEFASMCASQLNIPLRPKMISEEVDGAVLVAGFVQEATASDKPIYVESMGLPKGAFIRSGSTDQHCTEEEIARFYQERAHYAFDASALSDAQFDDLDTNLISQYRASLTANRPNFDVDAYSDLEMLRQDKLVVEDDRGIMRPTRAAILLFAKSQAFRRYFPAMRVDYIRMQGNEWVDDPLHRFETIDIEEPILKALPRAYGAILDDLPKANIFVEGELKRREVPKIPSQALREVLVNALMHRSYTQHAAIQIRRYPSRIEVHNRGHSLVPQEDLGEAPPLQRNPSIAAVLYKMGRAETRGSGIQTIRKTMRRAGLEPPLIHSDRRKDIFTITLFLHHFLDEEVHTWLSAFKEMELSSLEVRALVHARETGRVSNRTLRDLTGEEMHTASKCLTKLRDHQLLKQEGGGSTTYYEPTERLLSPYDYDDSQQHLSFSGGSETTENGGFEEKNGGSEEKNGGSDDQTGGFEEKNGGFDDQTGGGEELPPELMERVRTLKGRHNLIEAILEICAIRFFSPHELSSILDRSSKHIVHAYLTPLVKQGRMKRLHPGTPSHPQQAYRTMEES